MRRVAPALGLFFLSPFVGEFLLGDFGLGALYVLVALAPMYGGGAILIREVVRRTGRGWPSIVLLALAYGVLEEGLTTQSLFNPNYLNAHLLDQGFVPALGIAIPWTIFVLTIHTIWSMCVPIALAEEISSRRTTPWLRTPGTIVATVLFVIGVVADFAISYGTGHYLAPAPQLIGVAVAVLVLVVGALRLPRRAGAPRPTGRRAPAPWLVLIATLVLGAAFMGAKSDVLSVYAGVAVLLVVPAVTIAVIIYWSRSAGWGGMHRLAAAAGGLFTYAWTGFQATPFAGGGPILTPLSHIVFALIAVGVVAAGVRAVRRRESVPQTDALVLVAGS